MKGKWTISEDGQRLLFEMIVREARRRTKTANPSAAVAAAVLDELGLRLMVTNAILAEHRRCGTPNGYDGCYSHLPFSDHCRADGMAWPCDVELLRNYQS